MQDWSGPTAIRLVFDFAAQTTTITGEGRSWRYAQKPGYRFAIAMTEDGAMRGVGDAGPGVSDTLLLEPDLSFTWLQFTATTESSTVWTCRPA